jgi:hypothetical protein
MVTCGEEAAAVGRVHQRVHPPRAAAPAGRVQEQQALALEVAADHSAVGPERRDGLVVEIAHVRKTPISASPFW